MAAPSSPNAPNAPASPAWSHRSAIGCLAMLIGLCLSWELWLAPTGRGTLAIKVLPLVAAIPGLLQDRLHTYRWLSLAVWLYVGEGLVRSTSESGLSQLLAIAEVALGLALFAACVACIRGRRQGRAAA